MNKYIQTGMRVIAIFLFGAVSLCVFSFSINAQPMVKGEGITKVSDHVYVIPDNSVPGVPNVGIIVGSAGTLIIDTGMGAANGEIILEQAKKVSGNNQLYLATTHIHPEHDLGAHAFPAATKMIRSNDQVAEIAETGYRARDSFSSRSETNAKLLAGAEFRKADILFADQYMLDLGGVKVQISAMGPNHTPGDTAFHVAEENVLFTGDIAMKALPAFASPKSSVKHWLGSLDRLGKLQPKIVVPSHGPMGDAGYIQNYQAFLTAVQAKTAEFKKQGKSVDETVSAVSAALESEYGASPRIAGAIRNAYNEVDPG